MERELDELVADREPGADDAVVGEPSSPRPGDSLRRLRARAPRARNSASASSEPGAPSSASSASSK
jgi:hypothetical protein